MPPAAEISDMLVVAACIWPQAIPKLTHIVHLRIVQTVNGRIASTRWTWRPRSRVSLAFRFRRTTSVA
jgi:hypothetical protein